MPILMSNFYWGILALVIGIILEYIAITTDDNNLGGAAFNFGIICLVLGFMGLSE